MFKVKYPESTAYFFNSNPNLFFIYSALSINGPESCTFPFVT